mmetsp:Transcript_31157/g.58457  ORF Transcript_31157/g.58457 Transcript_31157/m.58457 type:complete len:223 (-) Transcript_31157:762-1430(-)
MHCNKRQSMLVVDHLATELGARGFQLQVRAKEVRLLFQRLHGSCGLVVKPGPVVASWEHLVANLLDRRARALVGHARVRVAIEDDGPLHPWRDEPVELDHARHFRGIIAGVVIALVFPVVRWPGPGSRGRAVHMEGLLDVVPHHPLRSVVVQCARQGPVQRRRIGKQVQLVDVSLLPALREAPGGRCQELAVKQLALGICALGEAWPSSLPATVASAPMALR